MPALTHLRMPAALAAAALVLASCVHAGTGSVAPAETTQTLRLYVAKSPNSLNPLLITTTVERDLADLAYDTLIEPDADNHVRPRLASVVPSRANGGISPDGKTITFRLRKNVRWHDGQPFTSADVAFTFAKIADPNVNISSRTGYDRIARVATPDPYTVVVTLKEPFAPFISYAGYQYPIVPKHLLAKSADFNRDPIGQHPIGTGPYRFKSWQRGSKIEYVGNDGYFGGAPKIPNLSIAEIEDQNTVALALRTHQLDMGLVEASAYEQLRSLPDLRATTEPLNDFTAFSLNTTSPVLRDVRIRRAISMAIDRASLAAKSTFGAGIVAYGDLPAQLWTRREPANPYAYDPQAANALLDAAGWKRGPAGMREKDGVPLRLRGIDYSGSKTDESIDVAVQQMLHDVGIDWSVKYYSLSLYYETKRNGGPVASGNFDVAALSFFSGIDPQNDEIYTCANRPPNGYNFAFYCSPAMDALQHDSLTTLDPKRRLADVGAIEKLAVTDVPYIFLLHIPALIVWNPRLHRTHGNISRKWYDIGHWTFEPS